MSTSIRAARPDDSALLARVVLSASRSHVPRGVWDLFVEDEAERMRFLESLLLGNEPHWCHHSGFLVAEADGQPAAALSGYPADGEGLLDIGEAIRRAALSLGWSESQVAAGFGRMTPFMSCHMKDEPGSWVVEWVAAEPAFRRRGLVHGLLGEILQRGRQRGHPAAQLTILLGNDAARRAYEQVGFRGVEERRDPAFEAALGTPGLMRMRIPLAS